MLLFIVLVSLEIHLGWPILFSNLSFNILHCCLIYKNQNWKPFLDSTAIMTYIPKLMCHVWKYNFHTWNFHTGISLMPRPFLVLRLMNVWQQTVFRIWKEKKNLFFDPVEELQWLLKLFVPRKYLHTDKILAILFFSSLIHHF
jgi:hypothetical protein